MVQWSCKDYTYHASESYLSLKIPLVKENSIFDQGESTCYNFQQAFNELKTFFEISDR